MKTNWAEKVWVNGPLRILMQTREVRFFKTLHDRKSLPNVLEIGCGQGTGVTLIIRHFRPQRVEAIDIDPAMIRRAERRFRRKPAQHHAKVSFRIANAQELPFDSASMDAVFNFGIIHHLEDWEAGIREIARVLRPGGVFYFEEIYPELYANPVLRYLLEHPTENRFRGPEYRAALEECGLHLVRGYRESRYTIVGAAMREGQRMPL